MTIRYRKEDADGDMVFGTGQDDFWVDTPQAVAASIASRLALRQGEWQFDTDDGTPYDTSILGHAAQTTRDFALRQRILDTLGVETIDSYTSYKTADRTGIVTAAVTTIFGAIQITEPQ